MPNPNTIIKKQENIGWLTINRPEVHNALSPATWTEIRNAIEDFRNDRKIRVVIIKGAGGKSFASGADIRAIKERKMIDVLQNQAPNILDEIENLDVPVIAAISGYALGGGCELAMACDIRIATSVSKFGLPEVSLGVIPGAGGTQRLQRLVGIGKAKELILTGDIISADEAQRIGLLNCVVDKELNLSEEAEMIAKKILRKGPLAVAMAKKVINAGADLNINSGLLFERLGQTILFSTDDRIEGINAFLEKRKPAFKGE